jgi:hypothetical protein
MLQTTTLKKNLVPEIGEASKKIGFGLPRWLPPLKEFFFVGNFRSLGSTRDSWVLTRHWVVFWLDTGSSFEPIVNLHLHFPEVGVYSQTWVSTFLRGCLRVTLPHCWASIRRGSCWTTLDTEGSLFGSVELLWTLKSHSLGQSEDQAKRSLISLKRIYNFWCSMLVFTPFA